jgi:DNA-binding CsgD family transcriptional regulator
MTAGAMEVNKTSIRRRLNEHRAGIRDFEKPVSQCAAELKRANRLLRLFNAFGRVMENAIHDLLHGIQRLNEHSDASPLSNKALAELRARYHSLTPRERDVMGLVVEGLLNKEIAAELGTAEVTVKIQRGSVMKKMKVPSVADLVRMSEKLKVATAARIAPRQDRR